ncbi:MAG: helix-turn-helix domain-containing protein [Acidimicrobiales bacterium]|nr:helix-turn-helix domain-containing protein [Acidimicrobiales bacterium]
MAEAMQYQQDLSRRAQSLADVLTQSGLASIVDVSRSSVSRWVSGEDTPKGANAAAVLDLDFIIARYALTYPTATFRDWFMSPNAFLNGATPKDVLQLEGPGRVIDALSSEIAGSFA